MTKVLNSLEPDQVRCSDLDPNCLQRLSTDDLSRGDFSHLWIIFAKS